MSLSFLFCKPWHPATTWNQKKIWEAEQKDAKRKRDEEAANKELVRESDRRRYEHMAGNKCEPDASSQSLNFMYAPPPGYQQPQEEDLNDEDEEVKKFKALAKMKSDPNFSAASRASELEKLVGRRVNPGVSLAEQQERFPFLKNAPVEHEYAADVKVNFKPFNNVVRHVKCMRCGEWGHRSGDRECKLANENPNDRERQMREDPMSYMSSSSAGSGAGGVSTAGTSSAGVQGHYSSAGGGEDGSAEDPDTAFLKSLSSKEKRRLLRRLQEMEAAEEGKGNDDGGTKSASRKRKKEHKDSSKGKGKESSRKRSQSRERSGSKSAKKGRKREKHSSSTHCDSPPVKSSDKKGRDRGTEKHRKKPRQSTAGGDESSGKQGGKDRKDEGKAGKRSRRGDDGGEDSRNAKGGRVEGMEGHKRKSRKKEHTMDAGEPQRGCTRSDTEKSKRSHSRRYRDEREPNGGVVREDTGSEDERSEERERSGGRRRRAGSEERAGSRVRAEDRAATSGEPPREVIVREDTGLEDGRAEERERSRGRRRRAGSEERAGSRVRAEDRATTSGEPPREVIVREIGVHGSSGEDGRWEDAQWKNHHEDDDTDRGRGRRR